MVYNHELFANSRANLFSFYLVGNKWASLRRISSSCDDSSCILSGTVYAPSSSLALQQSWCILFASAVERQDCPESDLRYRQGETVNVNKGQRYRGNEQSKSTKFEPRNPPVWEGQFCRG